jgi:nitrogen fixation NifU-like protein
MTMDREAQIEYLLDRYESPRHRRAMPDADVSAEGGNPGCGDIVHLHLRFDGDQVADVSFEGEGCTISQASADILIDEIQDMTIEQLENVTHEELMEILGKEIVQNRTKCAVLSLDTLKQALRKRHEDRVRRSLGESAGD